MTGGGGAEPFFLSADDGERYCLYHAPRAPCRGGLVYLHPFGDEMNRTRRMAALGARAFAQAGYGVLQIDLAGCGDSSGDFLDARWHGWKRDVALASRWLAQRLGKPVGLWGLRLGALLALDYAAGAADKPARLLLWQPVLSGPTYLTQVLRLRMAGGMVGGADAAARADSPQALRGLLQGGTPVEIGGYLLAPDLAAALDGLDAERLAPAMPVDWFEVAAAADRPASPAALRTAAAWQAAGSTVGVRTLAGPSFWATQEISEAPALIEASVAALAEDVHV